MFLGPGAFTNENVGSSRQIHQRLSARLVTRILVATAILHSGAPRLLAQQLEPGAYAVAPVGVNAFLIANTLAGGDLNFDPSLPIEDASATVNTTVFGYLRGLGVLGRSATLGVGLPLSAGEVEGRLLGEPARAERLGLLDPQLRFSINVHGAPEMTAQQFAGYRQKTNVGVSLVVAPPLGQYDPTKLINLGTNRWSFKPEVGISKAIGRWTVELYAGVWLFTNNKNFFGGSTRTQDPIGLGQIHLLYNFRRGMWIAFNANFYAGGRTSVDDTLNQDLQRNSRVGVTFTSPVNPRHSLRFAFSRGAFTTIGADFDALSIGYQFTWFDRQR